jgi:DNA-binding CsgD family transcriptional regulator
MTTTVLTSRQKEVLDLFLSGKTYKEVATTCGISPETVNPHLRNVAKKLRASGIARAELQRALDAASAPSADAPPTTTPATT